MSRDEGVLNLGGVGRRRPIAPLLLAMALLALAVSACGSQPGATGGNPSSLTTPGGAAVAPSATGAAVAGSAGAAAKQAKPNILFVLTDDMRFDDMQYLPQVRQIIGDQGMTFDNEFDNVTLCCPARTSILRGQYSHNTGVLTNGGSNGGFETAHANSDEQATVATAMQDAGYVTGLFGKYLNGYPNTVSAAYIPPGWDNWASSTKGNAYGEFNYTLNENGKQVSYGRTATDYGTDVYMGKAKSLIDQAAKDGKPFFVYLAVYAPHQPATPAPQDAQAFPGLQAPRDPSFDEADVSDKPRYIRDLPLLSAREQRNIDNLYRRRARSLQAVDRGVAGLIDDLRRNGQLDNTYVIFTSDNGFHLGQHRMPSGKQTAYETDIHLPLLIRGPGVTAGSHVSAITGNVDLALTIAALGQATMNDNPDGRSLVPFLHSAGANVAAPAGWRQAYLLEHWTDTSTTQAKGSAELEPNDPDQGGSVPGDDTSQKRAAVALAALSKIPEFQGLRTAAYTYVEYSTGERELYDITKDVNELNNIATSADPALITALHQRLEDLRRCAGDSCRGAEAGPLNLAP